MEKSVGRFNLRARKSLKLTGQIQCSSCNRHYFPLYFSENVENIEKMKNLCCDCEEREWNAPQPKKRAKRIAIKVEKTDNVVIDETKTDESDQFNGGVMVKIHSNELLNQKVNPLNVVKQIKIKNEQLDESTKDIMKISQTNRRKKTNPIQSYDEILQLHSENYQNPVQLEGGGVITVNDTVDSLRKKFPNVNSFELEFLIFLKTKKSE